MTLTPINIFALGGTIAMAAPTPGRKPAKGAVRPPRGTVAPKLTARALVAAVPGLSSAARIKAVDFSRVPGAHLTDDDLVELARAIVAGRRPAVVVQGTDTIEETAFALDLLVGARVPVVVTGAMRHPGMAGADGPANLLAAATVAASPRAEGLGTLVVMGDRIHAASLVRKMHTTAPDAFASPGAGPIGYVAEGEARILLYPAASTTIPATARPKDSRPVVIIASHISDTGMALMAATEQDIGGAVIAALGAGHLSPAATTAAEILTRRVPVVLSSRVATGPVLSHTYGFTGSETDLIARGLIRSGWLDPAKARILLALARRAGFDRRRIRTAFAAYGGG